MGKVEAFGLEGVKCWFCSSDHRPPHFHAKRRGQWCFRVLFMLSKDRMLVRVKGLRGSINARDREMLCGLAEKHREELVQEWERKVNCHD